jgi:hypothetical protein
MAKKATRSVVKKIQQPHIPKHKKSAAPYFVEMPASPPSTCATATLSNPHFGEMRMTRDELKTVAVKPVCLHPFEVANRIATEMEMEGRAIPEMTDAVVAAANEWREVALMTQVILAKVKRWIP